MPPLSPALASLLDRPDAERRLGPFLLLEPLGRGGFAPVWLAQEVYGGTALRTAAVKLFSLDPSPDSMRQSDTSTSGRTRIVEEARALCQVEHPNVVRFYALPIDEPLGVMGLAMEHVAGTSLDARLAAEDRLLPGDVLAIGAAVASALSAVHRAGLVHRDVKPSNIVEANGVVKLIDFGIAAAEWTHGVTTEERRIGEADMAFAVAVELGEALPDPDRTLQFAGMQSGTLGYMDPASLGRDASPMPTRDLYALGAMLYECLTGLVPAAAKTGRMEPAVLTGLAAPPPVKALAPETPEALAKLVDALVSIERDARPRSAEQVAIQLEHIRRELAGKARALPPEREGPFRGLGRFEGRDRDVFFGRTREVAAALEVLRGRGLLALVGPSGSGKSSLARAGVLPALAEGALGGWPSRWDTVTVEPGRDPRMALGAALAPLVGDAVNQGPEAVVAALAERAQVEDRGTVLLVDQLEELSTVAEKSSRDWAARLVEQLGEQVLPGVRVVVAARRDLLDPLLGIAPLGRGLPRGLLLVEPVSAIEWSEIVDQALAAYGYAFEDERLREEVLAALGQAADAMPLAQFALGALWEKRDREARRITRAGLLAIGGVSGALERHAEATLLALSASRPETLETARQVLLSLTTAEGTRAARGRDELSELAGPEALGVVEALEAARLVVPGEEGLTLAHEALLAQWARLRGWVAEAREERLFAEELERDAARWHAHPEVVALWQRRRLTMAGELRKHPGLGLSERAFAFLRASQRAERRTRLVASVAATVAVVGLLGVGAAYVRAVRAEEAAVRSMLTRDQENLRLAEQQNLRLEEAQERINTLIAQLNREDESARKREILREIQAVQEEVASPHVASPRVVLADRFLPRGRTQRPQDVAPAPISPPSAEPFPAPQPPQPAAAPAPSPAPAPGPLAPVSTW
ncbi:protein kinase domain-containing protein [Chondromyces crocatus]|uniref:Protein kinase domain-containing protein n=1 Tax=Chondromyces crocatus TaxID=52 RepID=A0A0K1EQM0_CHOCO|nr:protein kinase [Chondromyces crocatus]AKT42923.1 uncharacterized protein CMC5_071510 [Chondromyces crocatus]